MAAIIGAASKLPPLVRPVELCHLEDCLHPPVGRCVGGGGEGGVARLGGGDDPLHHR